MNDARLFSKVNPVKPVNAYKLAPADGYSKFCFQPKVSVKLLVRILFKKYNKFLYFHTYITDMKSIPNGLTIKSKSFPW